MSIIYFTLSIILPLVLNLIFTPIIIGYAHKNSIFDATDHRKTHVGNIPRLGGIGFFLSSAISLVIITRITKSYSLFPFYIATTMIFISGLRDDFKPIPAKVKLIVQILAATILILKGYTLSHIYIPFFNINLSLGYLKYPITYIWVIGVTNAINLLDGMDGQAGGVSALASLTMGIVGLITGHIEIATICFILTGALIGFLRFNLPPAKIFMGDCGSLTIGFFLSAIPLLFTESDLKGKVILVAIAVLLIPILDVFAAMIRRSRKKISFFAPDRGHIHHKFIDFTSLNTKQILLVIYSICIASGVMAIVFVVKTNIFTVSLLFINLILHALLFLFLHQRKIERSKNETE
ncbi:MAG: undecaprenyl/decaprenyl-phosphate alpha-N-acetylglucosaminyl 1-phosphate transferase [Spirochaetales bacterium]|nr:undecaprenyl/decaprenyl-phosphate alpha-N-acetylglucosaminyl 1-phosphate transferase [Spirochaetales bacterium]